MLKKLIVNKFLTATFWMFIATGFLNVGNYTYHLITARLLGPELYGVLESTISLLYIISVPMLAITLVVVKYVSTYKGQGRADSIAGFYYYARNKLLVYGLIVSIGMFVLAPFVTHFLRLPSFLMAFLLVLNFFLSIFSIYCRSILQGLSQFSRVAVTTLIESILKIVLVLLFLYIGFKAEGAFAALAFSVFIGFACGYFYIRLNRFSRTQNYVPDSNIANYVFPVFLATLAATSLFTADIVLVRYFFSGVESGYYAALSILGKVIFFMIYPLTLVMFPFISEHYARGDKYHHFFFFSILLSIVLLSCMVSVYFLFPEFMVVLLPGKQYLAITPLVGIFSVFIALYSLSSLFLNFYLSIHKTFSVYLVLSAAIMQIVLIGLFHSSLFSVVYISIVVNFLLLISLLLYYPSAAKR